MRIQIKNCVTDPTYKDLRRKGNPVFKPVILGSVLVPGAVRVLESSLFGIEDVTYLCSLVKSGSCLATEVGVGPVDFDKWSSSFAPSVQAAVEPTVEPVVVQEVVEEVQQEVEEKGSISLEVSEEVGDSEPTDLTIYDESTLSEMKNSDLRDIIVSMDPEADTNNKAKKKLISMILEMQNA